MIKEAPVALVEFSSNPQPCEFLRLFCIIFMAACSECAEKNQLQLSLLHIKKCNDS